MDSTTCGQNPVWAYFDKLSNGKASCKTCRYIFQVRQIILLVESESFHPGGGELTSGSPTSCSRPKWRWRRSTWANTRTRVWRWSSPILISKLIFNGQRETDLGGVSDLEREMRGYEACPNPGRNADVLAFCKLNQKAFPLLAKIVRIVLAIPASSSKSERVFSTEGFVVTPKRFYIDLKG